MTLRHKKEYRLFSKLKSFVLKRKLSKMNRMEILFVKHECAK